MKTHLFSKHGIKNPVRYKIANSTCLRCLRNFGTRSRLLRHVLHRCKLCAKYYSLYVPNMDIEEFKVAEHQTAEDDKNLKKNGFSILYSQIPSVVLSGPKGFIREGDE